MKTKDKPTSWEEKFDKEFDKPLMNNYFTEPYSIEEQAGFKGLMDQVTRNEDVKDFISTLLKEQREEAYQMGVEDAERTQTQRDKFDSIYGKNPNNPKRWGG